MIVKHSRRRQAALGHAPPHADSLRTLSISMPKELFEATREQAVAADRSMSNMICVLVRRGLKVKES